MRLPTSVPLLLALALTGAPAAHAQGSGMNCYSMAGGRSGCMQSTNALLDRLGADDAERQRARATAERRLAKRVAEAVRDGRCSDALTLALKSKDPAIAANTARLCGVPDPDAAAPKG